MPYALCSMTQWTLLAPDVLLFVLADCHCEEHWRRSNRRYGIEIAALPSVARNDDPNYSAIRIVFYHSLIYEAGSILLST
jgi:hypothetical protein